MRKIRRSVSCWEKVGDERLISDIALPEIPLSDLKKAFDVSEDADPMYEDFEITVRQAEFLQRFIDIEFDFDRYDYSLDTRAD